MVIETDLRLYLQKLYNLRCLYMNNSPAQKDSDSIGNTPHWYFLPLVKEKLVLLVLFLGNLMYYVRTETKRNEYEYE